MPSLKYNLVFEDICLNAKFLVSYKCAHMLVLKLSGELA